MNRFILLLTIAFIACNKDDNSTTNSKYINVVYDYQPAPGQFINTSIGTEAAAQAIIGNINNVLTLGAYGGYIVFGFDHSIVNKTGADFAIYANTINTLSEPGIVMVSQDVNGNGEPDDTWYELAGSEYHAATTIKSYRITYYNPGTNTNIPWKDNQGGSGAVAMNSYHTQLYYPRFATNQDSISFTGTKLANTSRDSSGVLINGAFAWGYADNYSYTAPDDYRNNNYNSLDISNAVNSSGEKVTLKAVDFIKVYTAQNSPGSSEIGEISTEIRGAVDLNM